MTAMPGKKRVASKSPKFIVDQIWDGAPDEGGRQLAKANRSKSRIRRSVRVSFGKKNPRS